MAEGKDIAWKPIAYCIGALAIGLLIGVTVVAPAVEKFQEKKKINQQTKK